MQVTAGSHGATKSWLYRFALDGKERRMGLGAFRDVSLAEAREKAAGARKRVKDGDDPIEARKASRAAGKLAKAKAMTFDQYRDAYIASRREPGATRNMLGNGVPRLLGTFRRSSGTSQFKMWTLRW